MTGRIHRDTLPRSQQNLSSAHSPILQERADSKCFYNKEIATEATPNWISQNQRVGIQDECMGEWTKKGQIINIVAPRSYTIRIDNGNIRRPKPTSHPQSTQHHCTRKRNRVAWGRYYNPCWKWQWHWFRLYNSAQWRKQYRLKQFCPIHGSDSWLHGYNRQARDEIDYDDLQNLKQGLQRFAYICFSCSAYGKKDLGQDVRIMFIFDVTAYLPLC